MTKAGKGSRAQPDISTRRFRTADLLDRQCVGHYLVARRETANAGYISACADRQEAEIATARSNAMFGTV